MQRRKDTVLGNELSILGLGCMFALILRTSMQEGAERAVRAGQPDNPFTMPQGGFPWFRLKWKDVCLWHNWGSMR
jgi:hypothetical protein